MAFFILLVSNLVIPTTAAFSEKLTKQHIFKSIFRSLLFNGVTIHNVTWKSPYVIESRSRVTGKISLVEFGIFGVGIWNTAQGIWNPTGTKHWNPESKFH